MKRVIALTIAGSDSSGGAGIQADLKTFSALGVYGASVITALTAQNTRGVQAIHAVPPAFILAQLASVADDLAVGATKIGMLADRETVEEVAGALARYSLGPVVVDPVMVAQSGDALIAHDAIEALRRLLLPKADVLTPNLHEAARLLEAPVAATEGEQAAQALDLLQLGPRAVLLKGGHREGSEAVDILATADGARSYARPRIDSPHTHGTGCTLSAALAALLAQGVALGAAVERAKGFVWEAIASGRDLGVGKGSGPVDHLHGRDKG